MYSSLYLIVSNFAKHGSQENFKILKLTRIHTCTHVSKRDQNFTYSRVIIRVVTYPTRADQEEYYVNMTE